MSSGCRRPPQALVSAASAAARRQVRPQKLVNLGDKEDSLLCALICVKLCSISSWMSTYTGGKFRALRVRLLFSVSEPFSDFSSSEVVDVFVDVGRRPALSLISRVDSGDV